VTQRMNYAAVAPNGVRALATVGGYVLQSGLPKPLIDLVYLRVSLLNGCAYCVDLHGHDLLEAKVAVQKVLLVGTWEESGAVFTEQERVALRWTDVVTRVGDTHVPEEEYLIARAGFGEKELADLTIAIGLMNAYNRLAISFRASPAPRV
jgi:AhpD family alkylhydroperoxidase